MKLHMLVSDGQSSDIGYHRTAAEEGLRGIQREHQHKGILFVAAAIGSGKENIERIYGDRVNGDTATWLCPRFCFYNAMFIYARFANAVLDPCTARDLWGALCHPTGSLENVGSC